MIGHRRSWRGVVIVLVALGLGFVAVRWADREFQRIEPRGALDITVSRPAWVHAMNRPYRRVQNAWIWVCVAVTLGLGACDAFDGRWRRPVPPGALPSLAAILVGGVMAANFLLATPAVFRSSGTCYGLRDVLEFRVPGAIVGTWVVTRGRKTNRRAIVVSVFWLANIGMLIGYAILFG